MEQNENQEVELDMNHLMKVRKEKLDNLIAEGKNPFEITKFNRTHTSEDIEKHYDELEGKDVTIVATGLCVSSALEAADMLAEDGIEAKVINIHTIKPIDSDLLVEAAKETGKVVTVEEHSVIGGLGSAVCDCLSEKCPTKVLKVGVNDTFGESGPAVQLIHKYGLDAEGIYTKVKAFV